MIKAVVVGINHYKNFPGQNLSGCVNDANDVLSYLTASAGADPNDITPLYDERATKSAIVAALHDMIAASTAGDHLLLHFSGHGSQIPSTDIAEPDGLDEVLCPTDFKFGDRKSAVTDDELAAMIASIPAGVAFTMVVDACHSGDISRDLAMSDDARTAKPRYLRPPADLEWSLKKKKKTSTRKRAFVQTHAVTVSACDSTETAADTTFDKRANGAFTYHWLRTLASSPKGTVEKLVSAVASPLQTFAMHPQIDGAADLRGATFLAEPTQQHSNRVLSARKRSIATTTRSIVLFETHWNSSVMGLPFSLGLRVLRTGAAFTFELSPSVAGAKVSFPVAVDGDASIPIPLTIFGQIVVDIGGWDLSSTQLDCDIAARVVPAIPFVPSFTVVREHLSIPLPTDHRELLPPQSATELYAMVELLRSAMPQMLQGGPPAMANGRRDVTGTDNTPFVAKFGQLDWGPNWREDRAVLVGSLPHNQIRTGEPHFFNQKGAGQVSFVGWLNEDPTDASFIAHIGNGFFGGWGSISYQVMAIYGNVDIVIQDRQALPATASRQMSSMHSRSSMLPNNVEQPKLTRTSGLSVESDGRTTATSTNGTHARP